MNGRHRILIVNCYVDETRRPLRRAWKIPQAMAPAFLAGAFSPHHCDIRIYSEMSEGPLEDETLLRWPDMLVLSGLITAFDRMRQVAAYTRTLNPAVVVVAGGPAVRALPRLSASSFDFACTGDVEAVQEVIEDVLGRHCCAETLVPRYDLLPRGSFSYVETTRNCHFRCAFCTLTGEGGRYQQLSLENIRAQIEAAGRSQILICLDNNFHSHDRAFSRARLDLLRENWERGQFGGWAALVSTDFFGDPNNVHEAAAAGCLALFCGLESFDNSWLARMHKPQNARVNPSAVIRTCHENGVLLVYGLMLDPSSRPLRDLESELDWIIRSHEVPLPAYISLPAPLPRTPFFHTCLLRNEILPFTKLRDLDSTTISLKTLDPIQDVARFVARIQRARGYRAAAIAHSFKFLCTRRGKFNWRQLLITMGGTLLFCAPTLGSAPTSLGWFGRLSRTHISTNEGVDPCYTPALPVDSRYSGAFRPVLITDSRGKLAEDVQELITPAANGQKSQEAEGEERAARARLFSNISSGKAPAGKWKGQR